MMDSKLSAMVCDQISLEQYSSALYLVMASAADSAGLFALSGDLLGHAKEEQEHASKWIAFLFDRGSPADLRSVDTPPPPSTWSKDKAWVKLCKDAVAHEERVTAAIKAIRDAAASAGDPLLEEKAREFLCEQIEEEDVAQDRLAMAATAPDPATFDLLVAKKA